MTKDLEQDLHNIFSAIFSGKLPNKMFAEDLRTVVNILNEYTQGFKSAINLHDIDFSTMSFKEKLIIYSKLFQHELTQQIEFNNESST
jgi:hypothetical protein